MAYIVDEIMVKFLKIVHKIIRKLVLC